MKEVDFTKENIKKFERKVTENLLDIFKDRKGKWLKCNQRKVDAIAYHVTELYAKEIEDSMKGRLWDLDSLRREEISDVTQKIIFEIENYLKKLHNMED